MSAQNEKTKLEAMYYHARDEKHNAFLASNREYAYWRKISKLPDGQKEETE